ncbi:MAG: sigma-70 family RNA polymerase sigma factor [Acutalibacteraceae bacterium]|nr:sigma-70 family RNA polymerase sigma factor [Acutalibacteraceae bacterium]MEE1239924.1 sigma-70 family RNA polymerase sigma factor [Acutalibacteraceae bacterium]
MSIDFVENYENLTDEEIVALINGGDFELLQVIISRYLPRIHYFVGNYCAVNEREDAVQEATYALYSAVKNFNGDKSSFQTFATLCIKRSVMASLKQSKRRKNIPDELLSPIDEVEITDSNSPEKIFFDRESYKNLTDSIRLELSGLEYSVLQLFLDGNKYIDIAKKLSITEKSVNNALLRIRKKLKNK